MTLHHFLLWYLTLISLRCSANTIFLVFKGHDFQTPQGVSDSYLRKQITEFNGRFKTIEIAKKIVSIEFGICHLFLFKLFIVAKVTRSFLKWMISRIFREIFI